MNETEILVEALKLESEEERKVFLEEIAGNKPDVRGRVEQILAMEQKLKQQSIVELDGTGAFQVVTATQAPDETLVEEPGMQIGPYRLVEKVGEGGMGSVWRAEQKTPVQREVALKVIKLGMDTRDVVARFEAERQALAMMSHRNIAKVLDAGATKSGRPYFVMELVAGNAITRYCDEKKLSLETRLRLFIEVCQAVQHAHQKGIIHRDIKPSNVLVATANDRAEPKVIDFGLAKATGRKLTDKTLFTAYGQVMGTPAYMSPEQADSSGQDIDTRTDVFSLGILLYELLAGTTPFDFNEIAKSGFPEVWRTIREVEAPPMSAQVSKPDTEHEKVAANRATEVSKLIHALSGDLEVIVQKAIEKDPERRYQSPNEFADDIERFLNSETIEARPASVSYRIRKMAQRNRGLIVAASVVFLSMLAGLIGTGLGLVEANRQTERAETNLAKAEKNYQFAKDAVEKYFVLISENRLLDEPHMADLRNELLVAASEFYEQFVDERQNDPDARLALGNAYLNLSKIAWDLGDSQKAIQALESATNLDSDITVDEAQRQDFERLMIKVNLRLADCYKDVDRRDDAKKLLDRTIEEANTIRSANDAGEINRLVASLHNVRGIQQYQQGDFEAATQDFETVFQVLGHLKKSEMDEFNGLSVLAQAHANLGRLYYREQKIQDALAQYEVALEIRKRVLNARPADIDALSGVAVTQNMIGQVYRRLGKLDEAEEFGKLATITGKELVTNHPELTNLKVDQIAYMSNLANTLQVKGEPAEANRINDQLLDSLRKIVIKRPERHATRLQLGVVEGNRANTLLSERKYDKAMEWYATSNRTLNSLLKATPNDSRIKGAMRNNYWGTADAYVAMKQYAKAVEAYDSAIEYAAGLGKSEIRMAKAIAIAKTGDFETVLEEVESETSQEDTKDFIQFDGARAIAISLQNVLANETLKNQAGQEKIESMRTTAISLLRKSMEGGFLKKRDSKSPLLGNEFKVFRGSPEFTDLLGDAEVQLKEEQE